MTPRTRIESAINARRVQLRMTWLRLSDQAGVTQQTIRQIRMGEPVSELTKAGVEAALSWDAGSIDSVIAGGEPISTLPTAKPKPKVAAGEVVVVSVDDLMTVLHGPLPNAEEYVAAVARLGGVVLSVDPYAFTTDAAPKKEAPDA